MRAREERIAEDTVAALDFMSRLLGAIEAGNWHYAGEKLGQLTRTLASLDAQLSRTDQQAAGPPVAAAVVKHSQSYRLGRALYSYPLPHDARLAIITKALRGLIPGASPAFMKVNVEETLPGAAEPLHTWDGSIDAVALKVFTALYGRPQGETTHPGSETP